MSTQLRIGAGACVLSIGLLVSGAGGAIASASPDAASDPGPSVSTSTRDDTAPKNPVADFAQAVSKTIEKTLQGVSGTINTLTKPGRRSATDSPTTPPMMSFSGTPTVYGTSSAEVIPDVESPTTPDVEMPTTPASDPLTTPAADPLTTAGQTPTDPPATPTAATPAPSAADVAPVVSEPIVVPAVVAPPATASSWFGPVVKSVASVPATIMNLHTSANPVADIVTSFQDVLTSIATVGSTSLASLPADLAALLGTPATTTPVIGGAAATRRGAPPATVIPIPPTSTVPTLSQMLMPVAATDAVPAAEGGTAAVAPASIASGEASHGAAPSDAPPATTDGGSNSTLSTVQRVIGAFVASVSITALVATALPGICALLATCAAGVRIGYRQAKAGATLPAVIARFAGSGPLGVVRSGSQVALHARADSSQPASIPVASEAPRQRGLWVVRDEPTPSERLLSEAV